MQRTYCPVCLEFEILDHTDVRDKSWKCSMCGATAENCSQVIIRFGNHFLTSRYNEPAQFNTNNHLIARRFPFDVAEKIRIQLAKKNYDVQFFAPQAAAEYQRKRDEEKARSDYYYAFVGEVERLAALDGKPIGTNWTYYISGAGCSQIVYGVDPARASGDDPYTAAEKWYAANKPTQTENGKKKARIAREKLFDRVAKKAEENNLILEKRKEYSEGKLTQRYELTNNDEGVSAGLLTLKEVNDEIQHWSKHE